MPYRIPYVCTVYLVLLSLGAAFTGLWLDELHQLVGTYHRSWFELIEWAKASPGGTPLNFIAQKISLDLLGFSSLSVRLPAILFGVASLALFLRLASGQLMAAAMFALLPQVFRYGVEARPYSQGLFFTLLAFLLWQERNRYYILAVIGGLYSQVFSAFIAAGQALWSRRIVPIAVAAACYLPWFLAQRATQSVTHTMSNYSFSWNQVSLLGYIKELSGGGYLCSIPLLILAAFGRDRMLWLLAAAGLTLPVVADATLGYFFAGRQLIFALPFLLLLALEGIKRIPRWASCALIACMLIASLVADFKIATTTREDWATPAHKLAAAGTCIYAWSPEQLQYYRIYEPSLTACDPTHLAREFTVVTTRYSPPFNAPTGYELKRAEASGIGQISVYATLPQ